MKEFFSSPYFYAAIVCVAAIVAAYGSSRIAKTRKAIAERTEKLVKSADSTLAELKNTSKIIDSSLFETKQANKKLEENKNSIIENLNKTIEVKEATIQAQKDIIGQITGGDSYPRLSLSNKGFHVTSEGTYNIPNLNVKVFFLKDYLNIPSEITASYLTENKESEFIYKIIDKTLSKLWLNGRSPLLEIDKKIIRSIINTNSSGFDIYFASEYRRWVQKIRLIKHPKEEKWGVIDIMHSEKITTPEDDPRRTRRIYLEISDNFPLYFRANDTNEKICRIILYVLDKKIMFRPNFVIPYNDSIVEQSPYSKKYLLGEE
jgi:hypothetical protein